MQPPGDVILCLLADEEAGSPLGADFLVREHPELFDGVRYSIGEFGGFTHGRRGPAFLPDHGRREAGLLDARDAARAGRSRLDADPRRRDGQARARCCTARPPAASRSRDAGRPLDDRGDRRRRAVDAGAAARGLLSPRLTDRLLDAFGDRGRIFDPLLHNTVSATIVAGGEKINVIPDAIDPSLDARLLPGFTPDQFFGELRALTGVDMDFEIVQYDPVAGEPDMTMFDTLAGALRELDPSAKAIPMMLPGSPTGGSSRASACRPTASCRCSSRQSCRSCSSSTPRTSGCPADAVDFGTAAIGRVLERF